jgi:hypothetical protein
MIEEIERKIVEQEINYEDLSFMDWAQNEINLLSGPQRIELSEDILNSENFRGWFMGNFYTFNYLYKEDPTSKFIPSYDRQPLIYLLKRKGKIIHGFNLNYLNPLSVLKLFMNDIFSFYYQQLDEDEKSYNSRSLATYENILRYDRLFASRAIYRKYNINLINSVKVIPKRYIKIYAMMGNGLFPKSSKSTVYQATIKHMNYRRANS